MRFKKGRLYLIEFLDHAIGTEGFVACQVVGWLVKDCKDSITLTYWEVITEDSDVWRNNLEVFHILKSTVKKKKLLD